MVPKADVKRGLSEAGLCRLLDIDRSRRRIWAGEGHLRQRGERRCSEIDVAELAVFHRLVTLWDLDRAREAWPGVRPGLKEGLWRSPLWVVLNEGLAEGALVHDQATLFAFAAHEGRFRILEVGEPMGRALKGFRNAVRAQNSGAAPNRPAKVQQLRKKSAN